MLALASSIDKTAPPGLNGNTPKMTPTKYPMISGGHRAGEAVFSFDVERTC